MKNSILLFALLTVLNSSAQKIAYVVLVGPDGITNDIKKAESFVVVKQFPDHFERLDYKMAGPLIKVRSYKDSTLTILNGNYYEYRPDGTILYAGKYKENKKDDEWWTYNDSGRVIKSIKYENDILIEESEPEKKDSFIQYPDEREAEFPGGNKAWAKYIIKSIEKSPRANNTPRGGKVIINFMVGIDGFVHNTCITKSAEFDLDEESLEIIKNSPKWITAWQNGKAVNAYRRQPLTYTPIGR